MKSRTIYHDRPTGHLNVFSLFHSNEPFGIPMLRPETFVPKALWPYNVATGKELPKNIALHFFLSDHKFEVVWSRPIDTLSAIERAGAAFTPDFSVYRDWPMALQIYNVYRNRWIGAFWQANGIRVIPTISWAGPYSYDYAFAGIPGNSIVAISTIGVYKDEAAHRLFKDGLAEMINRLSPSRILCYGKPHEMLIPSLNGCKFTHYPNKWNSAQPSYRHHHRHALLLEQDVV